ncbi:MAG: hypothetical protein Aurels2KO_43790 [Aureliella sp.]
MIAFYVPSDEYGFLCNFSAHGFILADHYWPTVEHYFQAQKFAGTERAERIRLSRLPKEAKSLGQTRKLNLRSDWEEVKIDVMRVALEAKFTTHSDLREALVGTGDEELVENAASDYFWGCGQLGNWAGAQHAREIANGDSDGTEGGRQVSW